MGSERAVWRERHERPSRRKSREREREHGSDKCPASEEVRLFWRESWTGVGRCLVNLRGGRPGR